MRAASLLASGTLALVSFACAPPPAPAQTGPNPSASAPTRAPAIAASSPPDASVADASPAAPAAVAASLPPDLAPDEICRRLASVALPAADGPSSAERAALAACDAEALYYGIGVPTDDTAARKCAYAHDDTGILMMIYANGRGVPRNVDVAVRLACDFGGAPMELEYRLAHLLGRGKDVAAAPGKAFDVCDDVTSGMMGGVCAAHDERVLAVARAARKQAAEKDLPATEIGALDRAAAAFFDARENGEVNLSGTLRAVFEIQERAALEDGYVASLEHVRSASLPPAGDFARADAELNAVYAPIMTGKKDLPGTVTRDGVRSAQRLWLRYVNAWVALGAKVRPEAPARAWRAWLTRQRVKMLRALVGE